MSLIYFFEGIPCGHVISCIWKNEQEPVDYVNDWYKKKAYMAAYKHQIYPLNPKEQWPQIGYTALEMPPNKAQSGRPKKLRRVEHDELPTQGSSATRLKRFVLIKCSECGERGHNVKTCFRRKQ